jgi:SAM-dependent methyltransferase
MVRGVQCRKAGFSHACAPSKTERLSKDKEPHVNSRRKHDRRSSTRTSWNPLAEWYAGWVGKHGSKHHRHSAIPAVLDLLKPQRGEQILDIGAGTGVLAPRLIAAGAHYTGIDISERMIRFARTFHPQVRFIVGDARDLAALPAFRAGMFDAAVFLLSIQDMELLDSVLAAAAWALRPAGRVVLLLTHPCFRVPRQSGWGWDAERKLQYRRVDRYLSPLSVPMKAYPGNRQGVTLSFHRPLAAYINGLAAQGLLLDQMAEIIAYQAQATGSRASAETLARQEFPLFLGLRARKVAERD